MSAEIRPFSGASANCTKLALIGRLEGHEDVINMAHILTNEEGVISISDDKLVELFLLLTTKSDSTFIAS